MHNVVDLQMRNDVYLKKGLKEEVLKDNRNIIPKQNVNLAEHTSFANERATPNEPRRSGVECFGTVRSFSNTLNLGYQQMKLSTNGFETHAKFSTTGCFSIQSKVQ